MTVRGAFSDASRVQRVWRKAGVEGASKKRMILHLKCLTCFTSWTQGSDERHKPNCPVMLERACEKAVGS